MSTTMNISFPGGKKVNAEVNNHIVKTDQAVEAGGEGSAPEPFTLFLASIGTCTGIYVKSFCERRSIPTEKLNIKMQMNFNQEKHLIDKIETIIEVGDEFPEKYKQAVIKAAEACTVKRHLQTPPAFETIIKK